MVYVVWLLVGVLAFVRKDSKIAALIVTVFIACIFCFNTANADLVAYQNEYSIIATDSQEAYPADEPLFVLTQYLLSHIGFPFGFYHAFMVMVSLACILSTIYRFSPYPAWTIFLYSIYPMTLDVTQIRFFMGYSFVFFSLRFLVDYQISRNKKNITLFFVFLALATGFHYSCIIYAILSIVFLDIRKHKAVFFLLFPVCIIAFCLSLNSFSSLADYIIGSYKTKTWVLATRVTSMRNILRVVITRPFLLLYSIFLSFVIREKKYLHFVGKNANSLGITAKAKPRSLIMRYDKKQYYSLSANYTMFLCALYICLFALLEFTVSAQYERLSRLGLLIATVLISRQIYYITSFNKICAQVLLGLGYGLYFFSVMVLHRAQAGYYIDYVFCQVMESNSLFGITY